ncbi:tol protein [Verticillium alfalfae VaMs.102]|uniref:Tol protein n=1 Tax=Verticillium alfalfae (strain VaMs.102 / ATCC MYA-4576 / FGSC 10136) TaxID=526221 RepID=C9SEL0_VERA1|nr:tol protein [Verticillium alfalfae VaMs.102]EEY16603.1 tol protein [Verticillium alfalfae VaMs.102]
MDFAHGTSSAGSGQTSASSKCCHLCAVLWFSMSNSELHSAKGPRELSLPVQGAMGVTTNAAERQPLLGSDQSGLKLAIWKQVRKNVSDESHLYMQLFMGSVSLGHEILIEDDLNLCNQRSLQDWETESRQMANVYAQASCTISATGSAESSGGCFKKRNPLPYFPCHILGDPSSRRSLTVKAANTAFKTNMFHTEVDGGPLNTRAWAFQERLLSQRIIHFGASLIFFECSTLFASELQPEGIYDGVDVLARDGTKHEFPDLDRWAEMLDPFLPPPQPSAPPALEPEDFSPPEDSAPSRPSASIKLPNTYGLFPSKHERQARARYNKAWNLYRARKRHRLEENAARERRHAARERARQQSAEQARLRKSEQVSQIPRAPNPAYKAPEVVASLSDNSVTGYRGAFDFLAAAAAAGSSRDIEPRNRLRLHQRWFELREQIHTQPIDCCGGPPHVCLPV